MPELIHLVEHSADNMRRCEFSIPAFGAFSSGLGLNRPWHAIGRIWGLNRALQEQIDAMLSGNLSFDTKKEGDEDDDAGLELWHPVAKTTAIVLHDGLICKRLALEYSPTGLF